MKRIKPFSRLTLLFTALVLATSVIFAPKPVSAAYNGANLVDNFVFLRSNSLSATEIQSFLVSKGGGIANMSLPLTCYGSGSREWQLYTAVGAPCGQTIPVSQIIYYTAQVYGVNPQVILATMQKEQSLITTPNPDTWQINQAMGYACPDSGGCGASYFFYQVDNGTWALRYHYERARGNNTWWNNGGPVCGGTTQYYSPGLWPGTNVTFYDDSHVAYRSYVLANAATSALYCYTPHAYNNPQGLYGREPFGTTGQYYSGSYNFVYYFERWFGSSVAPLIKSPESTGVYFIDENGTKHGFPNEETFFSYRYKWSDVVTVTQTEISNMQNGDPMTYNVNFRNWQLIKTSGSTGVYLVYNGTKRGFANEETFISQGYKWSDIVTVSTTEMGLIPTGDPMPYNPDFRNWQLLKTSGSTGVYLVYKGTKRGFPNEETFISQGYKWSDIVTVSTTEMGLIPTGIDMPYNPNYRDGQLVKTSGSTGVYLIESGKKRGFPDEATFLNDGYKWSSIVTVSNTELGLIPTGTAMPYNPSR